MKKDFKKKTIEHIVTKDGRRSPKIQRHDVLYGVLILILAIAIIFTLDYARDMAGAAPSLMEVDQSVSSTLLVKISDKYDRVVESIEIVRQEIQDIELPGIFIEGLETDVDEIIIKKDFLPKGLDDEVNTEVIYAFGNDLKFDKATVTLEIEEGEEVSVIKKCWLFNAQDNKFECESGWEDTNIEYKRIGNQIEFTVDSFSAFGGGGEPLAGEYNFVSGHPSIYLTPARVDIIRARCGIAGYEGHSEFEDATYECGKLQEQISNYAVLNNAFMYLLYKDDNPSLAATYADTAINIINLEYQSYPLPDSSGWGAGIAWGHWHFYFPIAYDWVYDELTEQEKIDWHAKIVEVSEAAYDHYDYGTGGTGANTYHTATAQFLQELLFAMASRDTTYGDKARSTLLNIFIPAFNELGTLEKGTTYTQLYPRNLVMQLQAWNTATDEDLTDQSTFLKEWPIFSYYVSYDHSEAGFSPAFLFHGDGSDPIGAAYWGGRGYFCAMAELSDDPVAWNYTDELMISVPSSARVWWTHIAFCDDTTPRESPATTYGYSKYFDPGETVIMRTGFTFDQQSTEILAKYGISRWVYTHGEDADAGHFDLIRGQERLLTDNRIYSSAWTAYWLNWQARSASHNVLLVCDPGEDFGGNSMDCGQTPLFMVGSPVNYIQSPASDPMFDRGYIEKFENTDNYTISSADLADAYSDKIVSYEREVVYLKPDVFLIFDRAETSDPTFETKILWHTVEMPDVDGTQVSGSYNSDGGTPGVTYDGNLITIPMDDSKAYINMLLPQTRNITKIGGPTNFSDSGTATSVVNEQEGMLAVSLTDPTKSWDINWLTHCAVTNNGYTFEITSNTGDTINVSDSSSDYDPLAEGTYNVSCRYFWPGSFEAYIDGTNYLATAANTRTSASVQRDIERHGAWRTEVKDTASTTSHHFLSVIYPTDIANPNIDSQLITDTDSYGALVETGSQDFIVMFSKGASMDSVAYNIPVSITGFALNIINNLQPNTAYDVTGPGVSGPITSSENGVLEFTTTGSGGVSVGDGGVPGDIIYIYQSNYVPEMSLDQEGATYIVMENLTSSSGGFIIGADNVTLDGNGHKISFDPSSTRHGVWLWGYEGSTVKNLEVERGTIIHSLYNIHCRNSRNHKIINNTLTVKLSDPSWPDWEYWNAVLISLDSCSDTLVKNNTVNGGFSISDAGGASSYNNTIEENLFFDENFPHIYTGQPGAANDFSKISGYSMYNTIKNNDFILVDSWGQLFQMEYGFNNSFINNTYTMTKDVYGFDFMLHIRSTSAYNHFENNTFNYTNGWHAVALTQGSVGPTHHNTFINNKIYGETEALQLRDGTHDNYFGGNLIVGKSGPAVAWENMPSADGDNNNFFHNTIVSKTGPAFDATLHDQNILQKFKDNIFYSENNYAIELANSYTNYESDYNLFFRQDGGAFIRYNGNSYTDLAAYQSASGQDPRSVNADPIFVDYDNFDFRPVEGSPACGNASDGGDIGALPCTGSQYPALNPGDVIVDQNYVGSEPGYFTDFSEGFANLSMSGNTLYLYPGLYREPNTMYKAGHWNIQGVGNREEIILTPTTELDGSLFSLYSGSIYRVSLASIGVSDDVAVIDIDGGGLLREISLANLLCPNGYAVSGGYLYLYLGGASPDPADHQLEIVDRALIVESIYIRNDNPNGDISVRNLTLHGVAIGGSVFHFKTFGYPTRHVDSFTAENIILEQSDYYLVFSQIIDNMIIRNLWIPPNHNIGYRQKPTNIFISNDVNYDRHYTIENSVIGPHSSIGNFRLNTPSSSALVDNVTVISAGIDHTGFKIRTAEPPFTPGTVTVRNSIFASWDYLSVDVPYCFTDEGYLDAAHDFMFWWVDVNEPANETSGVFDLTLENNLFAYSLNMNGGLSYAAPGSKLRGKNNIMINVLLNHVDNIEVDYWDNNFYHHENDYYGSIWANIGGSGRSSLAEIQAGWESVGYPTYDNNSLSGDPDLTDWDVDDLMIYDFTPIDGGNLCTSGEGGGHIGPIPCSGGGPSGDTYYVDDDPGCLDDPSYGSESNPWCTLEYAINQVSPGDTVLVQDGTYGANQLYRYSGNSGTEGNPITLKADGDNVVLDCGGGYGFWMSSDNYITVDGFEFSDCSSCISLRPTNMKGLTFKNIYAGPGGCGSGIGELEGEGSTVVVEDIVFENITLIDSGGISLAGGNYPNGPRVQNLLIKDCYIDHNNRESGPGFGVGRGDNITMEGNVLIYGGEHSFTIGNNHGNDPGPACFGDVWATNAVLRNNICFRCYDVSTWCSQNLTYEHNTFIQGQGAVEIEEGCNPDKGSGMLIHGPDLGGQPFQNLIIKNNIFAHSNSLSGYNVTEADHNYFYNQHAPYEWLGCTGQVPKFLGNFLLLSDWQTASGFDSNSNQYIDGEYTDADLYDLFVDPVHGLLSNPDLYDFRPIEGTWPCGAASDGGDIGALPCAEGCIDGQTRGCPIQAGVCLNSFETCTGGSWPGCNYTSIPDYQSPEATCDDILDNDCDTYTDCADHPDCDLDPACQNNCTLTSASWSHSAVSDGTTVQLIVTGTDCDATNQVNFTIFEDDPLFDDLVVSMDDNYDQTSWTAVWTYPGDDDIGTDPRDYYFEAYSYENTSEVVTSGNLEVSQVVVEPGTYYVDQNAASFASNCAENTQALPFQTIQEGMPCLSNPGDTLLVYSGTYSATVWIDGLNGNYPDYITIKAAEDNVVIDGSGGADGMNIGYSSANSYLVIDGFDFQNCEESIFVRENTQNHHLIIRNIEASNSDSGAIKINNAHDVLLDNAIVSNSVGGISISYDSYNIDVTNCTVTNSGADGFATSNTPVQTNLRFINCTATGHTDAGFDFQGVSDVICDHCLSFDNLIGIKFGNSDGVKIYNSILHSNSNNGIDSGSSVDVINCTIANNDYGIEANPIGQNIYIRNTVIYAQLGQAIYFVGADVTIDEDYNDFYHTVPGHSNIYFIDTSYTNEDIENGVWDATYGGSNTFAQEPMFVDEVLDDYTPILGSPLCDGGMDGQVVGALPCSGSPPPECDNTSTSCGIYPVCEDCDASDTCVNDYFFRDYYCLSNPLGCNYIDYDCSNCMCDCGDYDLPNEIGFCSDEKDNDCDTCQDLIDSDCGGTETVCTGGDDDDCDGYTDCADHPDCDLDPACIGADFNVYFECEDGTISSPFLIGTDLTPPPSNDEYVYVPGIIASKGEVDLQPRVALENIIIPQDGDYYLWLRMTDPTASGGHDALYIGFDGNYDRVWMETPSSGEYEWVRVEVIHNSGDYSHYLISGMHTVNIDYGENLTRADRIFITDNPAAIPTDEGCTDNDFDGYGDPASDFCTYSELDCDDDTSDDPAGCSIAPCDENFEECAKCQNVAATDYCGNAIDGDCSGSNRVCQQCSNGAIPDYGCICDGITYYGTGYCCDNAWQEDYCDDMCPDRPYEGFGATTPGGEGGTSYVVTSLADSGPGTLREALSGSNRNITFNIGGTILLNSQIEISGDHITLDASTAPAPGIMIQAASPTYNNALLAVSGHDIIVKGIHMDDIRSFPSDNSADNLRIAGANAYNIIIDHCTILDSEDGNLDVGFDAHDVTVQWCILGDNVKNQLVRYDPQDITFHHNLYVKAADRNPLLDTVSPGIFDMVNNVIFNWITTGTRIANAAEGNLIKNYYLMGPDTPASKNKRAIQLGNGTIPPDPNGYTGSFYMEDNVMPSATLPYLEGYYQTSTPYSVSYTITAESSAEQALVEVYHEAGACPRLSEEQVLVDPIVDSLPSCTLEAEITEVCVCDGAPYYNGYCCAGGWQIGDCSGATGECNNDAECDDSNDCTQNICVDPGQPTSYCSYPNEASGTQCGSWRDCLDSGCQGNFTHLFPADGWDECNGTGSCIVHDCAEINSYCSDDDPGDGINTYACGAECDWHDDCPDKCVFDEVYSGGSCNLGVDCLCYYSVEDCNDQDRCYDVLTGCEERDYSCSDASCIYSSFNQQTDYTDAPIPYCSDDEVREHRLQHDYYCGDTCQDHISWIDDALVEDCSLLDGWHNTLTEPRWVDDPANECQELEEQEMENRQYTCSGIDPDPVLCSYIILQTDWFATSNNRPKLDGTPCLDGLYCNGNESCNAGSCQAGIPPDCSDAFTCSVDTCDEGLDETDNIGICEHDMSYCDCEEDGECDDGNPCTDDVCNDSLQCENNDNDSNTCDDGMWCYINDRCSAGSCIADPTDLTDGVDCTIDTCDEDNDVMVYSINETYCDDGDWCNGFETCDITEDCQPGTEPVCSGNDISVSECIYIPDNISSTFDSYSFDSTCNESANQCNQAPDIWQDLIIHTCNISNCSAECESDDDCLEGQFCNASCSCENETIIDMHYIYLECEYGNITSDEYIVGTNNSPRYFADGYVYANVTTDNPGPLGSKVSLNLSIPENGTYYLWLRMFGWNSSTDALYIGVDENFDRVYHDSIEPNRTNYSWERIELGLDSGIYAHDLVFGNYSVDLDYDEPLARADRILITNNASFVPTGEPLYCGDGYCTEGETCINCPSDCGDCPEGDGDSDGDGDGPGGGFPSSPSCVENWTCTNWFMCINGVEERICTDINNCSTNESMPPVIRNCSIVSGEVNETFNQTLNDTLANGTIIAGEELPSPFGLFNFIMGAILAVMVMVLGNIFAFKSFKKRKKLEPHLNELDVYIAKVMLAGKDIEDIKTALVGIGWPEDMISKKLEKALKKRKRLEARS